MQPVFFSTPADFRDWMEQNHHQKIELWVGFHKKASGKPSITWPESVDVALCFGWIDGLRKSVDAESYKIRFTPRKPDSHWSAVNIKRIQELREEGLVHPAGLEAFSKMDKKNAKKASYEQQQVELKPAYEAKIKANAKAWQFFQELAPGYTKQSIWWVMSAKREETRLRRLDVLIESCEAGQKIPQLRRD